MYDRLFKLPANQSALIFGPRGVGKSSWLQTTFPEAPYFNLLDDAVLFDLNRDVRNLSRRIPERYAGPVVIDEIQKLPKLLDEVHRLMENGKTRQFILTGSSARKLKQSGGNLLAGRALLHSFYPLTAEELGKDFDLKKALKWGMLPTVWNGIPDPQAYLKSYIKTYVDLEVKLEALVRDLEGFSRFLEAAAFSQGSVLNVSAVARECGVERRSVSNYFVLLQDILLSTELPVFSKRAKRELVLHNKFFFFDAGVFRTLRSQGPLDSDAEIDGLSLETLVLQELRALNEYRRSDYRLYFWRTKSKAEVDFVLYGKNGLLAIEVKSSARIRPDDLSGLKLFREDYPEAEAFLIYGGDRRYHDSGIEIIPAVDFFRNAKQILE